MSILRVSNRYVLVCVVVLTVMVLTWTQYTPKVGCIALFSNVHKLLKNTSLLCKIESKIITIQLRTMVILIKKTYSN